MFDLVLIRHGETDANRNDIRQGHCDFPLTSEGIIDAEKTGTFLSHIKWSHIYSSDLNRASNTASIILSKSEQHHRSEIDTTQMIREVKFGIRDGFHKKMTEIEIREHISERDSIPPDEIVDDAESSEHVYARQTSFLATCIQQMQGKIGVNGCLPRVLAVSHGRFIRVFLHNFAMSSAIALAPPEIVSDSKLTSIGNCSITVLRVFVPTLEHPTNLGMGSGNSDKGEEVKPEVEARLVNWTNHLLHNDSSVSASITTNDDLSWLFSS